MTPTKQASIRLCLRVKRKRSDSRPTRPTAPVATAMDCGEIILPVTPPVELAATIRVLLTWIWWAVLACRLQKSAFDEVSDPVRKTPIHPRNGAKNGNATPVVASNNARVAERPE